MRHYTIALIGSMLLTAPLLAAEAPPSNQSQRLVRLAGTQLALQPGDAEDFARGLAQPLLFTQRPERQEFSGTLLVRAKPGHALTAQARVAPVMTQKSSYVEEYVIDVPAGMNESELASMLMATGDYVFAEPNWMLFPTATVPNDPLYSASWQHSRIQSANAWDINTGSSDVIVAVCDTGVDITHPDLQSNLVSGYNSWTGIAQADGGIVTPSGGHGTFVSGCAAAIGNNGTGVVGAGWNLRVMPIRITANNGTTSSSQIGEGARWAADNGAQIVNVSFTGATSAAAGELSRDLKAMGSLLFYAAGNDNDEISFDRPDMVIVAATTSSDNKWGSSNYGSAISIAAPGASVRSTTWGGGYNNGSGTSYASPIAAGVGAMILSVNPDFGPDDIQDILYTSADDLGASGRDNIYGHGRVNTFNAVVEAQSYTPRKLLPIYESFESPSLAELFVATSGTVFVAADPDAPLGNAALQMNATDTIESVLLGGRIAAINDHILSLRVKAQGVENGESLEIQYRDSADNWVSLVTMPSFGIDTDGYAHINAPLPDDFGYHGVAIRILAHGSDASDIWMIDDLRIEPMPTLSAPYSENFESGALSAYRWDSEQSTAQVDAVNGEIALTISDGTQAETSDADLSPLGIDGSFVNFFASTIDAENTDTLLLEYRDFLGAWSTLDTIEGSQLSATPSGHSFELPLFATGPEFRLRLSDTATAGGFVIDDLEISSSPLTLACNPADFAEPFSTLDIFDVLAFINAFNAEQDPADFAEPFGTFDIFDVLGFINAFNSGCP